MVVKRLFQSTLATLLVASAPFALAQGPNAAADEGFWAALLRVLLSFNSRGLLHYF